MSLSVDEKEQLSMLVSEVHSSHSFFNEVELKRDIHTVFVIRKMIARFIRAGDINEKLLLNNIVIILNTFGAERTDAILKIVLSEKEFSVAKAFLLFLDSCVDEDDIEPNETIISILKDTAQRYNLRYKLC